MLARRRSGARGLISCEERRADPATAVYRGIWGAQVLTPLALAIIGYFSHSRPQLGALWPAALRLFSNILFLGLRLLLHVVGTQDSRARAYCGTDGCGRL